MNKPKKDYETLQMDTNTACELPVKDRIHNKVIRRSHLPAGRIKRIHVNQGIIRSNHNHKEYRPVLTAKGSNFNIYGHEIRIIKDGEVIATFHYREDDPLSCGARVWVETREEIEAIEFEHVYPETLPQT